MSEKIRVNYGYTVIDEYKLPPLLVITECPIRWTLAQATSKKHAKHLAACIILGQPFNRNNRKIIKGGL